MNLAVAPIVPLPIPTNIANRYDSTLFGAMIFCPCSVFYIEIDMSFRHDYFCLAHQDGIIKTLIPTMTMVIYCADMNFKIVHMYTYTLITKFEYPRWSQDILWLCNSEDSNSISFILLFANMINRKQYYTFRYMYYTCTCRILFKVVNMLLINDWQYYQWHQRFLFLTAIKDNKTNSYHVNCLTGLMS